MSIAEKRHAGERRTLPRKRQHCHGLSGAEILHSTFVPCSIAAAGTTRLRSLDSRGLT